MQSPFLMAQAPSLQKQMNKIDSLIFYNNFSEGEKEINELYTLLTKGKVQKGNKNLELKLLLHKAYLYDRAKQPDKALKISLGVASQAQKHKLPQKEYRACLSAAIAYERSAEFNICKKYLDRAFTLYQKHNLDSVYSMYCVRLSSYFRFIKERDSAVFYARSALAYAQAYQKEEDYIDACLLLGILLSDKDFHEGIPYSSQAAHAFLKKNNYEAAAAMYNNMATVYLHNNEEKEALKYSDSSLWVFTTHVIPKRFYFFKTRYQLFDKMGNKDSAHYYFQKYHDAYVSDLHRKEATEIKAVTEKYEHDKKEAIIQSKDKQLIYIITLLTVITGASLLLIRKNRKISTQNKIISKQVEELLKTLGQKQVLLSELQHRVKNNLQHVISILEIQKESVDFNNIDELIRGNQNRIHSMALLHKKLNMTESVNEVCLPRYILELSELVKDSYDNHHKKITLHVTCTIEKSSIEKALPIGLIIVELISNSMKHAFRKQHTGTIQIVLKKTGTNENSLSYADNGSGFDFNTNISKGLGIEITKGLIGQLDATVESSYNNGFKLAIRFT